jgi:hypothetical protein
MVLKFLRIYFVNLKYNNTENKETFGFTKIGFKTKTYNDEI